MPKNEPVTPVQTSPTTNKAKEQPFANTGNTEQDRKLKYINSLANEICPLVTPVKKSWEKVFETQNNSSIVLGREYGKPTVDTGVGMIDLAVGRTPNANLKPQGDGEWSIEAVAEFFGAAPVEEEYSYGISSNDAARIYMSQRTDIDSLFDLPSPDGYSERSAVGIKADSVRIISRDAAGGIKLMVHQDPNQRNSFNGDASGKIGVQLVAGGRLEPMVKANALSDTLLKMLEFMTRIENMVVNLQTAQGHFNTKVAMETHMSPFYGTPDVPDPGNPQALGKCSLEGWTEIMEEGRFLQAEMKSWSLAELGAMNSEAGQGVLDQLQGRKRPSDKQIRLPKFASTHHKLD